MVRVKTKTSKTRDTFEIHRSSKKRAAAAAPIATTPSQLLTIYEALKAVRRLRILRLSRQVLGAGRVFAGTIIIPTPEEASQTDTSRLEDIWNDFETGKAAIFWVDGSERDHYLGAGVVWPEGRTTRARSHSLGRNTGGSSGDAELFAIAAAMRRAKRSVQRGSKIQLVRVYSDAQSVLRGLESSEPQHWIGPLQGKKTVLQKLYDNTDWLASHNVRVEVVWVKGHSSSNGNRIADRAANRAVDVQIAAGKLVSSKSSAQQDVPSLCNSLGPDWPAERLYRMLRAQLH